MVVKKKNLLILLAVIVTIAAGTLPASATTYYVKNGGDDSADGLSDATAWATISKVNSETFAAGDTICFKRGSTWRIMEDAQLRPDSGSSGVYVTYTDYGTGDLPLFLGSIEKNSDWTDTGGNKWDTANNSFAGLDVGSLIFNNEASFGSKKWNSAGLTEQGDFYYDGGLDRVLLYSTSNPADYYTDIECAVRKHIIDFTNKSYVIIENMDLRYGGAHGIWGESASYIIIRDNDISYIGGSEQGNQIRFGNGVELWNNVNNIWVERNRVWEIYDAALTNQSGDWAAFTQTNLYFRYNIVWNSAYAFEYFPQNSGTTDTNIYVENNTFVNSGDGWSYYEDPRGHLLRFWKNIGSRSDFYIRNNILYQDNIINDAYDEERLNRCMKMDNVISGLTINYNTWYKPVRGMINYGGTIYRMDQFSDYQAASGWDASSIATDANLIDVPGHNYRLESISPCIDIALDTGQTEDFDYNPIVPAGFPDIGAFEWGLAADFDRNGTVDFLDYALFGSAWRTTPVDNDYDDTYDLVDNDSIDYDDFGSFIDDWLWSAD